MSAPDRASVIVGIDGSAPARAALHWALHHAELVRSRVCAVAVWHPPISVVSIPGAAGMASLTDAELGSQARRWLGEAMGELPSGADAIVTTHAEMGDPPTVLLELAQDAELLVLGNKARGALASAIVGSVVQSCLRRASCPVVLVPEVSR
jgi:nucleotide-binding universal stress UspA family protein